MEFLRRIGRFLWALVRMVLWLAITAVLCALIAVFSVSGAVVSGIVALAIGWWTRGNRTVGTLVAALCLLIGVGLLVWKPDLQNRPLASCSVYPIPFVQLGSPARADYVPVPPASAVDPKPWIAATVAPTYGQLQIIEGAQERIGRARDGAIAYARDTGTSLVALDALLRNADARLTEQRLTDLKDVRSAIERRLNELTASTQKEAEFVQAWGRDPDVRRVSDVALVLTNLDNEIARLFTGIQPPVYAFHAAVQGRDLVFREMVSLTAVGGRFTKINPSGFVEAARQRGITPELLWSPQPSAPFKKVGADEMKVPGGSSSVALGIEWKTPNAVVDTCRRLSALPFQAVNVDIPASYSQTIRGEVLPDSKKDTVPIAVTFTASNTLKEIRLPAYSYFLSSAPMQASIPVGENADEQVHTLVNPITAESSREGRFWIEMLPPPLRWQKVQEWKEKLFPANAAITLILLGIATLGSVVLSPLVAPPTK